MLKRLAVLAVLCAALLFLYPVPTTQAALGVCDPKFQALCAGLVEWFNFEEGVDTVRFGSFADSRLYEKDGMDVSTAAGKIGSYAALFDGSNYFHNQGGGPTLGSGYWTIAMWIYPTAGGADKGLMSSTSTERAISLDLEYRSSNLYPRFRALKEETLSSVTAQADTYVSQNAWSYVVFTMSMYGDYGQARACISVNNQATPACTTVNASLRAASNGYFDVGRTDYYGTATYFTGRIDGLTIVNRAWSTSDISTSYNAGSPGAFPWY